MEQRRGNDKNSDQNKKNSGKQWLKIMNFLDHQLIKKLDGPKPPPPLPSHFKEKIQQESKDQHVEPEILIVQKKLSKRDVTPKTNTFYIPSGHLQNVKFLKDHEKSKIGSSDSVSATIIDPTLKMGSIKLYKLRESLRFGSGWIRILNDSGLQEGDIVQLWAVRVGGNLWFVLVRLTDYEEEATSSAPQRENLSLGLPGIELDDNGRLVIYWRDPKKRLVANDPCLERVELLPMPPQNFMVLSECLGVSDGKIQWWVIKHQVSITKMRRENPTAFKIARGDVERDFGVECFHP
ncbi:hypothetical protein ACH5RR_007511 [Cinchona calisaya]|uniref:TF-B3 domain-containing protein n=1 Tax=Cinchona calisaya TaxID=153742 RepID=A0ABD3AS42_9GENT